MKLMRLHELLANAVDLRPESMNVMQFRGGRDICAMSHTQGLGAHSGSRRKPVTKRAKTARRRSAAVHGIVNRAVIQLYQVRISRRSSLLWGFAALDEFGLHHHFRAFVHLPAEFIWLLAHLFVWQLHVRILDQPIFHASIIGHGQGLGSCIQFGLGNIACVFLLSSYIESAINICPLDFSDANTWQQTSARSFVPDVLQNYQWNVREAPFASET